MTTSSGQAAGAAKQAAGQTTSTAKDEAVQVGQTATAAASDVAGTAKEQAGQVAGEAVDQVRMLADQAKDQVSQQAGQATQQLSDRLRALAGEVRDMGQGKAQPSGTVAGLAQQLADRGEQMADYLAGQGPGGLVQDLRTYAARRPGTFLLGALAAGVATGRLVKGASASQDTGPRGIGSAPSTSGSTGAGAYGATTPAVSGSYVDVVPAVVTDDAGVVAEGTAVIGPVSGDQRLMEERLAAAEPRDPGSGLR